MQPLVSIIVPIYNVELFIERCVKSLIEQTYHNIEIILVNDGSPDNCGTIIDRYKEKDSRIITIHKSNEGVSAARNDGLDISSGEYIMFVDGDDYIESDYVEYFVSLIRNNSCEMAVGLEWFYNEKTPRIENEETKIESAERIIEEIYSGYIGVAVWNKIYCKSCLLKHSLRFNTNFWFAEGMLFNILCLQYVDKVATGNKRVYHTVENMDSATRKFNLESWFCGLRSMEYQRDHWIKKNQDIQIAWEYHYRKYAESILRGLIKTNSEKENELLFQNCIKILSSNIRIPIQANIYLWKKEQDVCMAIQPELYIRGVSRFSKCSSIKLKNKLLLMKFYSRIPYSLRLRIISILHKYYKKHYKPIYLNRKLL